MQHIKYLSDLQTFVTDNKHVYFKKNVVSLLERDLTDMGNLLIYGRDRTVCNLYLNMLLTAYWKSYDRVLDLNQIVPNKIVYEESKNCKPNYESCHYFTRIDMDQSNVQDRATGMSLLNSLTANMSIDNHKVVVILDRIDNMATNISYGLRKILDLPHVQYILVANKLSNVEPTIQSRVLPINLNVNKCTILQDMKIKIHNHNLEDTLASLLIKTNLESKDELIGSSIEAFFKGINARNAGVCVERVRQYANKLHTACIPLSLFASAMIIHIDRKHSKQIYRIVELSAEHDLLWCQANKKLFVYESYLSKVIRSIYFE